jgi:hypothetical protein
LAALCLQIAEAQEAFSNDKASLAQWFDELARDYAEHPFTSAVMDLLCC